MNKIVIFIFLILISCRSRNSSSVNLEGGFRAVGNISADTIYNGAIKIYDSTGKLFSEGLYSNGVKNGKYKEFNENGTIKFDLFYADGKENGIAKIYNNKGEIFSEDFYFYGLRCGNALKYRNGKLNTFSFYSLENIEMMHFFYDSLKNNRLTDLSKKYFFFSSIDYSNSIEDSIAIRKEYFIYTPNPPMQEFDYSLVTVDKNFKVQATLKSFDKKQPWSKFTLDGYKKDTSSLYAIKLLIVDTIRKNNINLLKILK